MVRRISLLISVIFSAAIVNAGNEILEIKDIGYEQIYFAGFVLNGEKKIDIEAVGAGAKKEIRRVNNSHLDQHSMFAYAWIINAETREMVWRMTIDNTDENRWSEWNRSFEGKVRLPEGEYEVYYSAVAPSFFSLSGGLITVGKVLKKIFSNEEEWDEDANKWKIRISGVDEVSNQKAVKKYTDQRKEFAIVQLSGSRDGRRYSSGFSLSKPLTVELYAIGEGFDGEMYDYASIMNAQTREQVWKMREVDTEYAGGAVKNRVAREAIKLNAGDYLVSYRLDDTHSIEEWNSNPPYDPFFWGVSLFPKDEKFDRSIISKYTEEKLKPIVSITQVGDYAYKEEGLKLTEDAKIRIYALGEGRDGEMFDYGWLSNVDNGETVWKMRYHKTQHAGGASKNRLFDGVIDLEKGEYVVYYQSDDSHSYEDWNMHEPDDAEHWGISIYPIGKESAIQSFDLAKAKKGSIIAQLVRVGDDEHIRKQFQLSKKTRVRIYSIGEGDWDEMYDYSWIQNEDDNDRVWRMRYKKTKHAGGAKKNRLEDTIITLEPGTYTVHYRSDDSHSYHDWNSTAPDDERNWGITIYNLSD